MRWYSIEWRRLPESNRGPRICNPLHSHSAKAPYRFLFSEILKNLNLREMVPRAGLEPAQRERRGILNPLCLPIPPPGQRNHAMATPPALATCAARTRRTLTDSDFRSTDILSFSFIWLKRRLTCTIYDHFAQFIYTTNGFSPNPCVACTNKRLQNPPTLNEY